MQVEFTKHFERQIEALRNEALRKKLKTAVSVVMDAKTVHDIPNLKKLKGHTTAYRIRLGDYRVGLFIEDNQAIFALFEHRKDIYQRFP